MKVERFNYLTREWETVAEGDATIRVQREGLIVQVRPDRLRGRVPGEPIEGLAIQIDSLGRDGHYGIDVEDVVVNSLQALVRVRSTGDWS